MECNKEEALRAKQIAETRMQSNDFSGALRIAQKALRLFPELENMSQLMAVCEVHCSAQKKAFGNEVDWYAVLQVENTADEITLKKQFRKLALLLHPDKNKLPGAEAAFKFIGEANRVLSDRVARNLYDKKYRNSVVSHPSHAQKPQSHQPKDSGARNHNGIRNKRESNLKFPTQGHDTNGKVPDSNGCQQVHQGTFLTCCSSCHLRYKCSKHFEGKSVRCQSCGTAFIAQELRTQDFGIHSQHDQMKSSNIEFSKPDASNKGASSSSAKLEEVFSSKDGVNETAGAPQNGRDIGQSDPVPEMDGANLFGRSSQQKQHVFAEKNLNDDNNFVNPPKRARNDDVVPVDQGRGSPSRRLNPENVDAGGLVQCPDPEFSDFDKLRSDFAADQVWACYDHDGMPRYYARIRKVLSPGFKLRFVWLESMPKSEAEIDWCHKELPVACGFYMTGSTEETEDPLMFSHQIRCFKVPRKQRERLVCYAVYPRKGEIWAIFKNWDIKWASDPQKHIPYRYEYVEVLSDFHKDSGVEVACLHKVRGFVSLYQRADVANAGEGANDFYLIPPDEKYRFSHQVPSFKMTGEERTDVPPGSFELDPAGLDPDELQDSLEKGHAEMGFHETRLESKSGNKMADSGNISGGEIKKVVVGLSSQFPAPKLNPRPESSRLDPFWAEVAGEANKEHNSRSTVRGGSNNFLRPVGSSFFTEPDIPPKQDPVKSENLSHDLRRSPRIVNKSHSRVGS
ncbi:hypothetical protein MLD38_035927 [Melastoma candidum]|uniref:Uncharacterized protein n=1 Tax=Melastoma candidum TaxID=119954 RepID=A0ACB9LI39_9MYRT|nr:hypothetical protein MLD38_035927 [Melastoma candidum]